MHRTRLTEEQKAKVLEGLFHGTMFRTANDSEDDLTWVYLNCKKFAACIRSDGLVDVTFESRYEEVGWSSYERRDTHGSVTASFWITSEEIKPYFQKYLPETYPEYVREKVDAILDGEVESPGFSARGFGVALVLGCVLGVVLEIFMCLLVRR